MDCFLNSARAPQGRLTVAWRFIARYECRANLQVPLGTTDSGIFAMFCRPYWTSSES
jgi:hypothetical protein